jgi:hypothetical protein
MTTQVTMFVQAVDGGAALAMAMLVGAIAARSAAGFGRDRGGSVGVAVIFLSFGFAASTAISAVGGFGAAAGKFAIVLLALSLVVPLAVGVTLALASSSVRRLISQPEVQPNVVAVHALRFLEGSVFVAMVPLGVLPAIFALPAGLGDVLVGLGALAAVRWISSGRRGRVIWWNLVGLLDLANATVLGLMTVPGPLHFLQTSPTSALLLASPLTIIPTFCVPIFVLLHLISLRYLMASRRVARLSHAMPLEVAS